MSKDFSFTGMIGRLTKDAELNYISSGTALTKFSIANNDMKPGLNGGPWIDEVSFFDCILWGKTGISLNQYLSRGQQVLLEGRMRQERWVDKNTNYNRSKVTFVVSKVQLLGKNQGSIANKTEELFKASDEKIEQLDDELAF
jgi:single-strand DNA-binding protein